MFSDPRDIVDQLHLSPDMKVADFGSGSGHYSLALAEKLREGRVYAVDVQRDLLERLKTQASKTFLTNIETVWGDIEKLGGTKLRDGSLDMVIVANLLFQVEDKKTPLLEAKRVLKPSGRLLLVDWSESFGGMGPAPEAVLNRLDAETLLTSCGFELVSEVSAGAHHYGIIFKKHV
jgi:ubiquinone/menaquinone biosynthesis C-methylase UbiE